MKKLLQLAALLTLTAFFLPVLTVGFPIRAAEAGEEGLLPVAGTAEARLETAAETELRQPEQPAAQPGYDASQTVTLWQDGAVREMTLGEYLVGVVAAEMPAGFPEEALKAQAVAARSYALYKLALYEKSPQEVHHGAQLCADAGHCEAFADLSLQAAALWPSGAEVYEARIRSAVEQTDGWVLTWKEQPIAAVFCAASAQQTETAEDIWGAALPYLVSVESPGGDQCGKYYGQVTLSQADFAARLKAEYPAAALSGPPEQWFRELRRSAAGSVLSLEVGGQRLSGRELRRLLGLNSANFTVKARGDDLIFETVGYGHGVGLSQYGARYLALAGQSCAEILAHYYPGTLLEHR